MAVYGAYWDESGVNKDDPWLTVAGFLSTSSGWVEFTAEWQKQLAEFRIPFFHARDFNNRYSKDFGHLTSEERVACSKALVDAITKHAIGSVSMSVPSHEFRRQMARSPARIKSQVGHPYAAAAHLCIVEASGLLRGTLGIDGKLAVNHMFSNGPTGRGQLMVAADYEAMQPKRVEYLSLGSLTWGDMRMNAPLQAADFLVWEINRMMSRQTFATPPPIRTSLRRFWDELPHRWFSMQEGDVGMQLMMALIRNQFPPN